MSDQQSPGQGKVGSKTIASLPAASSIYAPPQTACDNHGLPPTVPVHLWLGLILAIALLLFSIVSWLSLGFARFFPLIDPLGIPIPLLLLMALINGLIIPLQVGAALAQAIGAAIWQGCVYTSLRRVYGPEVVSRGWASGLWWLVPIASMFMPLLCLRELRYLIGRPRDKADPKGAFGSGLIMLGVILAADFLLSVVIYGLKTANETSAQSETADMSETIATGPAPVTPEAIMDLATCFFGVILAFVTLAIVVTYFRRQRELFTYWNDDAHWLTKRS